LGLGWHDVRMDLAIWASFVFCGDERMVREFIIGST
jgi:hypothetical protein